MQFYLKFPEYITIKPKTYVRKTKLIFCQQDKIKKSQDTDSNVRDSADWVVWCTDTYC